MKRLIGLALVCLLVAGCAEASPQQTVNIRPGAGRPAYSAGDLAGARRWLAEPHPGLPHGWRYAVLLATDPKDKSYHGDCGKWVAAAAFSDGSVGRLCDSWSDDEAVTALLYGPGDAVAFDDHDHDQTFTPPKELRLIVKNVAGAGGSG